MEHYSPTQRRLVVLSRPSCQHPLEPQHTNPVPHHEIVNALIETFGFRHIGVHKEE